jgi:hypothetical protein
VFLLPGNCFVYLQSALGTKSVAFSQPGFAVGTGQLNPGFQVLDPYRTFPKINIFDR